ncbi:MAG: Serine-tRNA ligase [Candidatus Woesebacteria bacterium GW2011_GWA2_40_7]|uniref:Serine--tRNA ligase n=3 Tax=Candidatus Woeseibacteriota TaxID=1752722 RepID=A0A0G0UV71_9BACT|nr:MAG: Serine-tRNA ligase [Candidatus Woesebacteria bacterium GW2011_GWB1_39_10]KKR74244.1 MAG: Serine-tRNA ligase [Candidatus Woesebacteria bacterium GW2011_GWA2_40_7]KKR92619.1 MAG: Serine-tRNA ligase [Candidatus Woesebacteria bacterium GW2011_GWA1_41_13b]
MLDINFIRDNKDKVIKATKDKGFDEGVIERLLTVDAERRKILQEVESIRAERNKLTKDDIEKGRELKTKLKNAEENQKQIESDFNELMYKVPNLAADDVKVGTPEENEIVKTVGEIPKFDFPVRDHLNIGKLTDSIDFERGAKVAQSGFYYFKNDLARLELALAQYAFEKLAIKGFTPVITPNVARERNIVGCGFQARSDKERQIYHIEDEDLDLIATAEITLVGMHTDETFEEKDLPKKYVGYSSCYRKEIGSYGKDVRGILRVHEFKKVEMVVFCKPEDSDKIHEELLAIEEGVYQELGIPYQVVKMVTGDLGNAASKKYDLEAWMPSQDKYREITSTSNTTDFQARRLNIKFKREGKNEFVHTLNGTITTTSRTIIAILENFQQKDGSVLVPKVLQKWMGKEKIELKI